LETQRQGPDLFLVARDGVRAPERPDGQEGGTRAAAPFRILGPLEVHGTEQVAVTARRQEVVLGLLLLSANRVVPLETMIYGVWGAAPPTTARAQVQTAVSVLRRSLGAAGLGERIRMRGLGYSIDLAHGELDLHLFDDLVARGRAASGARRPDAARAAFRRALALWRGEPLAGLDSEEVRARLVRVAERRIEVLEECVDAELRLGLHREVLGEIRALVAEYPLRERPVGQLMRALYRSGRQAEALAAYQAARRTFVRELGLEPSPELHRLELAILNRAQDLDPEDAAPAAVAALPVPRMLPARIPDFVDHGGALAALCRRLSGAADGQDGRGGDQIRVAVITGGGGVGKSAAALAAAHVLASDFPDGQLYARVAREGGSDASAADLLERFLRALGFSGAAVPDNLEGRAALFRSAIADRRLLIVVDDVTDEAQLRALIPGTPACRLLATSRARLAALPGATVVEIAVPGAEDGVRLLAAMVGHERVAAEPAEALELVERCGGLPLALRAAASRLAARPHWNLAQLAARLADENRRLDELTQQGLEVRAAFRDSYDGLARPAKLLFGRLGALHAESFAAWVAAPLLDLEARAAADVLESLVDARLVDVAGGSGSTARYRLHGLARLYARERWLAEDQEHEWTKAFRRLLGAWLYLADEAAARIGGGFENGGAYNSGIESSGVHNTSAHESGDAPRWPLARTTADAVLADPPAWYERESQSLLAAVRQAASTDEYELCWNLAVAAVPLVAALRRFDDWRDGHAHALRAARQAGDRRGEAVLLCSFGALDLHERRYDQAAARLYVALSALERLGEPRWRRAAERTLAMVERARGNQPGPGSGAGTPRCGAEPHISRNAAETGAATAAAARRRSAHTPRVADPVGAASTSIA
jgi:DNA-binding SARP family transcriptional activator